MRSKFPAEIANKTIMVVDDFSFYRDFIKQFLVNYGHRGIIIEAVNNRDAIEKINKVYNDQQVIDIIIADLHLPDGNSTILIDKIRKNDILKSIPILLLTTEDKTNSIVDALNFGFNDYCFKPIDQDLMLDKLVKICTPKK